VETHLCQTYTTIFANIFEKNYAILSVCDENWGQKGLPPGYLLMTKSKGTARRAPTVVCVYY
jgi:hypothetical protein